MENSPNTDMIRTLAKAARIEREGFTAFRYNTKADGDAFGALYVHCFGEHPRRRVPQHTRAYFVVAGVVDFEIEVVITPCKAADLIILKPNTAYSYKGACVLFEVNVPPTGSEDAVPA